MCKCVENKFVHLKFGWVENAVSWDCGVFEEAWIHVWSLLHLFKGFLDNNWLENVLAEKEFAKTFTVLLQSCDAVGDLLDHTSLFLGDLGLNVLLGFTVICLDSYLEKLFSKLVDLFLQVERDLKSLYHVLPFGLLWFWNVDELNNSTALVLVADELANTDTEFVRTAPQKHLKFTTGNFVALEEAGHSLIHLSNLLILVDELV